MRRYFAVTLFLLSVIPARLAAQDQSQNHRIPVTAIRGAEHPELIPDVIAYRLFLVTVSELPDAPSEARRRQMAHLKRINITDTDRILILPILNDFKAAYTKLVADYNQIAEAAWAKGLSADEAKFLKQRDDLVQFTKLTLAQTLSPEAMAKLDAHVQAEKQRMVIYVNNSEVAK